MYQVEQTYDREPPVVVTEILDDEAQARLVYEHFQMVADHHQKKYQTSSTVILTGPDLQPEIYQTKEGEDGG